MANIYTRDQNKGWKGDSVCLRTVRTMWVIGRGITNTGDVCGPVNNAGFARRVISDGKHLNCSDVDYNTQLQNSPRVAERSILYERWPG